MWRKQSEFEGAQAALRTDAPSTPPTPAAAQPESAAVTEAIASESGGKTPSADDAQPRGRERRGAEPRSALQVAIVEQLKTVFDPEIPVNIYELGLIYDVSVADDGKASIHHDASRRRCARPPRSCLPRSRPRRVRVEGVTGVQPRSGLGSAVEPRHDVGGGAASISGWSSSNHFAAAATPTL